jgi:hypothetical protein
MRKARPVFERTNATGPLMLPDVPLMDGATVTLAAYG